MEDKNNKDNNEVERDITDGNKMVSYVNDVNETHKLNYSEQKNNESQNSMNPDDIKLKEENDSKIKDNGITAKNILKDEEKIKNDELSSCNDDFLELDVKILEKDDKDCLNSLDGNCDDKNINTNENETPEDSKNLHEKDSINENDVKMDSKKIEGEDVFNSDDKVFKRYRLRQRQSKCYTFDEPPPLKKKKTDENQEDSKTDYDCPICYASYTSKRGLSIHMAYHEQPEKFTCAQCTMEFPTNKELINHKKVHEAEDTIFSCVRCKVAYSNILEFLLHKADHYKPGKECHCEECGRVFSKRSYKLHLPTHFATIYKCDICHKISKNRLQYMQHTRSHEANTKYPCGECGKECKSKKYYEYHMSSHTGLKLYQCLYCGKGFRNNCNRKIHTRIHTGEKPFQCEICKKTFRQATDRQRHMLHHNAIKTKFICDICGQAYSQKPTLAIHMRIHTRQNLVSCPICNKKFPLRALLKSHYIYQHTNEKPYKCDTCKVSFKRLNNLQRHLKLRKHNNMVYGLELKNRKKENLAGADGRQTAKTKCD